jgi:hypothetical protein
MGCWSGCFQSFGSGPDWIGTLLKNVTQANVGRNLEYEFQDY